MKTFNLTLQISDSVTLVEGTEKTYVITANSRKEAESIAKRQYKKDYPQYDYKEFIGSGIDSIYIWS